MYRMTERRRYSSWVLKDKSRNTGIIHRLFIGLNKIGRHSTSDFQIKNSTYISRHHAEITVAANDQTVTIKDLNSMNGILINMSQYNDCTVGLNIGDIIGFGIEIEAANSESDLPIFELIKETVQNDDIIVLSEDDDDDDTYAPANIQANQQQQELNRLTPTVSNIKEKVAHYTPNNVVKIFDEPDNDIENSLKTANSLVLDDNDISIVAINTTITPAVASTSNSKSPNIFEESLNNCRQLEHLKLIEYIDNNNKNQCSIKNNEHNNHYNDDLMFSQVLLDDIKAEFQNEDESDINDNDMNINVIPMSTEITAHNIIINKENNYVKEGTGSCYNELHSLPSSIKQEILAKPTKPLDPNICWTISDDEESDKELEDKVNCWSQRLFSQRNKSPTFEVHDSNNEKEILNGDVIDSNAIKEDSFSSFKNKLIQQDEGLDKQQLSSKFDTTENFSNSVTRANVVPSKLQINDENMSSTSCSQNRAELEPEHLNLPKANFEPILNQVFSTKQQLVDNICDNVTLETADVDSTILTLKALNESLLCRNDNDKIKKKKRSGPIIINAPKLTKPRNKLRGVSAHTDLDKTRVSLIEKLRNKEITKELQKKWNIKPKTKTKSYQLTSKEKQKLGEKRKKRLKELALKEKKDSLKRKGVECKDNKSKEMCQKKKVKVKLTANNRGAFLTKDVPPMPLPPPLTLPLPQLSRKDHQIRRSSISYEYKKSNETFSQQINKPDQMLIEQNRKQKRSLSTTSNEQLYNEQKRTDSICKAISSKTDLALTKFKVLPQTINTQSKIIDKSREIRRSYRTTNKITFTSIEKYSRNTTESTEKNCIFKPMKKVRFNDTPVIHYIESIPGANRRITGKDFIPLSNYGERRLRIRNKYPIIDRTDKIINDILQWSNQWLLNKSTDIDTSTNIVAERMPYKFNSFEQYQRILFSLMQLEYITKLERAYSATNNVFKYEVEVQNVISMTGRLVLTTKYNYQHKHQESYSRYELVLLGIPHQKQKIFAYISSCKGSTDSSRILVLEILYENDHLNKFHVNQKILVRPVMDYIRIEFSSFNAIYQLKNTPLFEIILNPMKLLEYKKQKGHNCHFTYKGYDSLNERQQEILLNTYAQIIDETKSNVILIQGPPGTGKSVVITNLALQTLYGEDIRFLDKKILICAQSNAAVDVITRNLYNIQLRMRNYSTRFRLIRFGNWDKINTNVKYVSLENIIIRDLMKKSLNNKKLSYAPPPLQSKDDLHNQIIQLEQEIFYLNANENKNAKNENDLIEKQRDLDTLRSILSDIRLPEPKRKIFAQYLTRANIVCTTLPSCVALSQYIDYFDVCIIDEATQCIEPWSLLPLKFGPKSLVLVGDTKQLPATVLSQKANDLGLGTSLFTRVQRCLENNITNHIYSSEYIYFLNVQYRMHPEICLWPNKYFYNNKLINGPNTERIQNGEKAILLKPFTILNLSYTQNNSCANGLISNDLEAEFVTQLLRILHEYIPNDVNSYGVITPYAQQRNALEKSIRSLNFPNVFVNTIDSYQGIEKDVILISNARTNGVGFLSNPQRLNVALTRARKLLILCGNFKRLETIPVWKSLMENGRSRNLYYDITPNCINDLKANVIEKIISK